MVRVRPSSLAFAALSALSCLAALAALANGCALPSFTLAPPVVDAGHDMPETGPPGCMRATYPDPPGGMDDGTALPGLVFAVHSIDLGDNGDTPGYDLDNVCTCFDDAGPSCTGRSPQLSTYCDATGGIDNQAAKLFELIELPLTSALFGSDYFSAKASEGCGRCSSRSSATTACPTIPRCRSRSSRARARRPDARVERGRRLAHLRAVRRRRRGEHACCSPPTAATSQAGCWSRPCPPPRSPSPAPRARPSRSRLSAGVLTAKITQQGGMWALKSGSSPRAGRSPTCSSR